MLRQGNQDDLQKLSSRSSRPSTGQGLYLMNKEDFPTTSTRSLLILCPSHFMISSPRRISDIIPYLHSVASQVECTALHRKSVRGGDTRTVGPVGMTSASINSTTPPNLNPYFVSFSSLDGDSENKIGDNHRSCEKWSHSRISSRCAGFRLECFFFLGRCATRQRHQIRLVGLELRLLGAVAPPSLSG